MKNRNRIPGEFRAGDDSDKKLGRLILDEHFFWDHPKNLARHSIFFFSSHKIKINQ
jgi:hypothetical protein